MCGSGWVLPPCRLIEAVAALRREVTPHTNTAKLPLLRRAELAAARAVPAATAIHKTLANATWAEPQQPVAGQAAGKSRGKKAAAAAAAASAGAEAGSHGSGVCFSLGADAAYDAAVEEQQQAQEAFAAELQAAQQWYSSSGRLGGWGQQQQQLSVHVQEMFVADESEGVLGLVSSYELDSRLGLPHMQVLPCLQVMHHNAVAGTSSQLLSCINNQQTCAW